MKKNLPVTFCLARYPGLPTGNTQNPGCRGQASPSHRIYTPHPFLWKLQSNPLAHQPAILDQLRPKCAQKQAWASTRALGHLLLPPSASFRA
jgi:hypothetical protein